MEKHESDIAFGKKQSVLKLTDISILLNSYDDIFSDFDPRGYSERTISDDFLVQAIKFSKNIEDNKITLHLMIPKLVRNEDKERLIIKRLHGYFRDSYQRLNQELKKLNNKGILLSVIGFLLMVTASYLSMYKDQEYYVRFLLVLFEPSGWFLLWAGLDHLIYQSKSNREDQKFYSKMIKCEIRFLTY